MFECMPHILLQLLEMNLLLSGESKISVSFAVKNKFLVFLVFQQQIPNRNSTNLIPVLVHYVQLRSVNGCSIAFSGQNQTSI